jgi:malate dehydrogenase (decarboxylating)
MGKPMEDLVKQKIVVVGAGSAGLGVVNMVKSAMQRLLGGHTNETYKKAIDQFWILDKDGLVTKARDGLTADVEQFARETEESEGCGSLKDGATLLEVVKAVKPDVLLGLSGVGGLFTQQVLEAMKESGCPRPAIFPLSNPTSNAECTAKEAFQYAGPNIIFASGSPFRDVDLGGGKVGHSNQGNNMYFFPGIGLGTLLAGAHHISDGMLHAAAEELAAIMTEEQLQEGIIYPPVPMIREITARVAASIVKEAVKEDIAVGYKNTNIKDLRRICNDEEELMKYIKDHMWSPDYSPLVYPFAHV